ncbi:MAG: alpha/beta hydrolase [Gammaproteobacteria bacterium]
MPLEPSTRAYLDLLAASGAPPIELLPHAVLRRAVSEQARAAALPKRPVGAVMDRSIAGPGGELPVRIYVPQGQGPFPVLVYFHGGGWVICDLDTHDAPCRDLCADGGCIVVSVDYRLAPEHPFPAAHEDCFAATRWVHANAAALGADPDRIAVGGDSAGGNLALVVALRCRDEAGPRLRALLPIYPVTDLRPPPRYASQSENGGGEYGLSLAAMAWFIGHYIGQAPATAGHPHASPILADLSGLPPAFLMTAEYDPLRDEGAACAQRLREAGVPVRYECCAGLIHGFFNMRAVVPAAGAALDAASAWLAQQMR